MSKDIEFPRPLPALTVESTAFWRDGARGVLSIYRCQECSYYVHPPVEFCPRCESRKVAAEAVSGHAHVVTFTVNHKQWMPGLPVPYVLALVAIDEQEDVRLATNIVDCPPENVHIGMKVTVRFEPHDDVWVPLFAPRSENVR